MLLYAFVELALGMAYLAHSNTLLTHCATVILMGPQQLALWLENANSVRLPGHRVQTPNEHGDDC
jgi:hypothetical protein